MKKLTFPLLLATALVAASCSNDDVTEFDDSNLSRIELGGANNMLSRAGFTVDKTTLKLHYVSTRKAYNESTFPYTDGEGKGTLYMTSTATAAVDADPTPETVSAVSQTTGASGQMRYWDDLHGKNSTLSLYSIAVPNKTTITKNADAFNGWDDPTVREGSTTVISNDIAWTISTTQTSSTMDDEDLTFSNNITGGDALGFIHSTKKFEIATGEKTLVFNHALSRFTIDVKKGEGFGDFATEFNVSSVKLSGFNTTGTLNVTAGTITSSNPLAVETVGTKAVLEDGESNQIGYTYKAQVFPKNGIKDDTNTLLTVVVDGNNYYISGDEIYTALKENNSSKEDDIANVISGNNYKLTIIINKTGIKISAARLVDWNTVSASEETPSNAMNLTAAMEKTAGDASAVVASDLYRSTTLATGYTTTGNKTTLASDGITMGTTWYWPDNSTSYYLRTISPQGTVVANGTNDNITMTGGAIADGNDYIWGAPLKEIHSGADHNTFDYAYATGYNSYLYDAIGVTKSEIHITQFHMMSKLQVNLTTSTGDDAVNLSDATVEIMNYYNTATLNLSNAAITQTGAKVTTSGAITANAGHTEHTWRVIPQATADITLKITASGNVYLVKLPSDTGITSWLPGKAYIYNFKLLKTGIVITSAKLVNWQDITAAQKDITLEN